MIDQRILVQLDAILDTRLGAISRHSHPAATAVMRNGYWDRENDDFEKLSGGLITNEQYQAIWKNRDVSVMRASYLTNFHHMLMAITKALQHKSAAGVEVGKIYLDINTWPYELTTENCEVLVESLRGFVAITTEIHTVNVPMSELTPQFLMAGYDALMLYDFDEWDVLHRKALDQSRIPQFTISAAAKLKNGFSRNDELFDTEDGKVDPFKALTHYMTGRVTLAFEPLYLYSIIRPSSADKSR